MDDPAALLGRVLAVEELALGERPPDESDAGLRSAMRVLGDVEVDSQEGDVIKYYGLKITTTAGRCTIDYRNASNGYYGGSIEVVEW